MHESPPPSEEPEHIDTDDTEVVEEGDSAEVIPVDDTELMPFTDEPPPGQVFYGSDD